MTPATPGPPCRIEELGHTAEIGFRLWSPTPEALFACAAAALFQIMRPGKTAGPPEFTREVALSSIDREALLVDWLNELLYLYETTHAVWEIDRLTLYDASIRATAAGRRPAHPPDVHIKAVTYHQLAVEQTPEGWTARVFVDI